jgi:hypothetical protein
MSGYLQMKSALPRYAPTCSTLRSVLWLLRPACWLAGHRWDYERTTFGPVARCQRCGLVARW